MNPDTLLPELWALIRKEVQTQSPAMGRGTASSCLSGVVQGRRGLCHSGVVLQARYIEIDGVSRLVLVPGYARMRGRTRGLDDSPCAILHWNDRIWSAALAEGRLATAWLP